MPDFCYMGVPWAFFSGCRVECSVNKASEMIIQFLTSFLNEFSEAEVIAKFDPQIR